MGRVGKKDILYSLPIAAAILEVIRLVLFVTLGETIFWYFLSSSILLSLSAVIIHFWIIDVNEFCSVIHETDKFTSEGDNLNPIRYINLMPIAMITCTIADAVLPFNFIGGMLVFLFAHIFLIIAFSGIIHVKPIHIFSSEERNKTLISFSIIGGIAILSYIFFIFNPTDIITIIVIPYVIAISLTVVLAMFGMYYTKRNIVFRSMVVIGAALFMASDLILAINKFSIPFYGATFLIVSTYLLANFLLQFASINLMNQK